MLNCNKLRQIKSKTKIVEDAGIITLKETVRYLEIEKCKFYKMAREGKIHNFTDYFLESRINLRYIQEISEHENSKTTGIYKHVSKKSLGKIVSYLNNLEKR